MPSFLFTLGFRPPSLDPLWIPDEGNSRRYVRAASRKFVENATRDAQLALTLVTMSYILRSLVADGEKKVFAKS